MSGTGFEPVIVKGESLKFLQVFPLQELGLYHSSFTHFALA